MKFFNPENKAWQRIAAFCMNPRNLFVVGFVAVLGLTFSEVVRGRHGNFMIFAESTKLFWQNIAPYNENWAQMNLDYFLYGPLFNILFAPFAYMPPWLGPFAWNIFNFSLWFAAIFTLPEKKFTNDEKCKSFMYTLLILACAQLSFQYNVAIAYIYLFSYTLLEKNKGFWAVLLMLISGFTKIYGIFQLMMLVLYPRFWRNTVYAVIVAIAFLIAPAINMPLSELPSYYGEWIKALTEHKDTRTWMSIFYLKPLNLLPYQVHIQIGALVALIAGLFANRRKWREPTFKIAFMATLMGYIILFSNSSEGHTYVISLIGYQMWYWTMARENLLNRMDKILYWLIFVIVVVMPVDIFCPPALMNIFYDLQVNLWLIIAMWLKICYNAYFSRQR